MGYVDKIKKVNSPFAPDGWIHITEESLCKIFEDPKNELLPFNNEALAEIEDCIRHYVDDDTDVRNILLLISKLGSSGKLQLDEEEVYKEITNKSRPPYLEWERVLARRICDNFSPASDVSEERLERIIEAMRNKGEMSSLIAKAIKQELRK